MARQLVASLNGRKPLCSPTAEPPLLRATECLSCPCLRRERGRLQALEMSCGRTDRAAQGARGDASPGKREGVSKKTNAESAVG